CLFFQAEDGIRDRNVTRVQTCALPISSSSGKTTTAHLLRDYLTSFGANCVMVSLDDFYLGTGRAPQLPDGKFDYESVDALDVERSEERRVGKECGAGVGRAPGRDGIRE